ncbi:achaete-scute homolog 3-like [Phlebotomus argentipes]|uniref:achaete-scute homolog 3-like n=1 Tax=Phlebotomus argentipes TaxID=94469 RepID=UPI0028934401|nr:achaete-scute homolog 3-like [Phlebotomus argentipes]
MIRNTGGNLSATPRSHWLVPSTYQLRSCHWEISSKRAFLSCHSACPQETSLSASHDEVLVLLRISASPERPLEAQELRRRTKAAAPSEPQTVQIRNARERSRVKAVNEAYEKLRQVVPAISNRRKRVSKVKTLRKATQYIQSTSPNNSIISSID